MIRRSIERPPVEYVDLDESNCKLRTDKPKLKMKKSAVVNKAAVVAAAARV